jgi:hypothetical protein
MDVTCVKKKSFKLPFPNEGGSKKEMVNGIVMWHEKDVALK